MSDLLGMVRRHWWIVAVLVLLGIGGGWEYTTRQPKVFESATSVLVQPTAAGQDTNVSGGRTKGELNLDTEAQLVRSTAVAADAAKLLRSATAPDSLATNVAVEVPANTSVLLITYRAPTARIAQAGSHAFAEAYLRNREETAANELSAQIASVEGKLKQLNAALAPINARLATLRSDNAEKPSLESQRSTITSQVNTLAARHNQLSTTTVNAGKIIRDANLPVRPSKPVLPLNLGSGAAVGLLLGVGAALLRERLDRRVRRPADLTRRCDVPVLAALAPRVRPRLDDVFPPFGAGGRVFNRLRNEVVATGPDGIAASARSGGRGRGGQVIVVAGASRGSASTVVAANLAAAFARTGGQTVLVCAHLPDSITELAPVTRLLSVRAVPGLSDVLAGRVPLGRAVQRAPRQPRLSVITTGGTASAAGLLQSQTLRDTLVALRGQAEYVVIEAPATSMSADAQSVASLADTALIAVELRRTRYADVIDAAEQLRRVGTPLLGAVVLPKLVRHRDEPPPPPASMHDLGPDDAGTDDVVIAPARDADTMILPIVPRGAAAPAGAPPPGAAPPAQAGAPSPAGAPAPAQPGAPAPGSRARPAAGPVVGVDTAVLTLTGIDMNGIERRRGADNGTGTGGSGDAATDK
jgi:Mrp family chromosome partitioning ATPase